MHQFISHLRHPLQYCWPAQTRSSTNHILLDYRSWGYRTKYRPPESTNAGKGRNSSLYTSDKIRGRDHAHAGFRPQGRVKINSEDLTIAKIKFTTSCYKREQARFALINHSKPLSASTNHCKLRQRRRALWRRGQRSKGLFQGCKTSIGVKGPTELLSVGSKHQTPSAHTALSNTKHRSKTPYPFWDSVDILLIRVTNSLYFCDFTSANNLVYVPSCALTKHLSLPSHIAPIKQPGSNNLTPSITPVTYRGTVEPVPNKMAEQHNQPANQPQPRNSMGNIFNNRECHMCKAHVVMINSLNKQVKELTEDYHADRNSKRKKLEKRKKVIEDLKDRCIHMEVAIDHLRSLTESQQAEASTRVSRRDHLPDDSVTQHSP